MSMDQPSRAGHTQCPIAALSCDLCHARVSCQTAAEVVTEDNKKYYDAGMYAAKKRCGGPECCLIVNPMHHRTVEQFHIHFFRYQGSRSVMNSHLFAHLYEKTPTFPAPQRCLHSVLDDCWGSAGCWQVAAKQMVIFDGEIRTAVRLRRKPQGEGGENDVWKRRGVAARSSPLPRQGRGDKVGVRAVDV